MKGHIALERKALRRKGHLGALEKRKARPDWGRASQGRRLWVTQPGPKFTLISRRKQELLVEDLALVGIVHLKSTTTATGNAS